VFQIFLLNFLIFYILVNTIENKLKIFFNIGVGKILDKLGYHQDFSFGQTTSKKSNFHLFPKHIFEELSIKQISLTPGSEIDLGGVGKGWLIDKLKLFLESLNLKYFLLMLGGMFMSLLITKNLWNFFCKVL
jgi:thiamine biosynthesis lipoprotein ApbE